MERADALGELDNTMPFYLSDNGYLWGEHGAVEKKLPYTPSVNVPFYLRWPGHFAGGTTDERLVTNVDIAPTILEATGVSVGGSPPMDGTSMLEGDSHDHVLLEHWFAPHNASLRSRSYQYDNLLGDADASNDPSPALIRRLGERLAAERKCKGTSCP